MIVKCTFSSWNSEAAQRAKDSSAAFDATYAENRGGLVYDASPKLSDVLARASFVVSHGGSGLAQAALRVGRPQVIAPIKNVALEKSMSAIQEELDSPVTKR